MSKDKMKYPRIVGYKVTINVDWEDGENEDIDISNVEIRDMENVLEGLESERADDLGWREYTEEDEQ
jgi:hypothetical protein